MRAAKRSVSSILNNIAPRLEWARTPLAEAVAERRNAVLAVRALVPQAPAGAAGMSEQTIAAANSAELAAERDRLDGEISDLIAWTQSEAARGDVAAATALLRRHVHDELTHEMKMTRKPLFAEISKATAGGQAKNGQVLTEGSAAEPERTIMDYHLDPRMPRPDQCVQRYMIERWAREQPDKTFAIFADGEQWTYGEMQACAIRTANALRALGVKQAERVLVWLPNTADCLRVWFGLNYLGAVFVPINTPIGAICSSMPSACWRRG